MIALSKWRLMKLAIMVTSLAVSSAASAHQLDEYLQATLVTIGPDDIRLQINLTPGSNIAGLVIGMIDRDRDGVISKQEATAYAESLKRDLAVRLDQREVELTLTATEFPELAELRTGFEIIQLEYSIKPGKLTAGAHQLSVENCHLDNVSAYLINATKPESGSIRITGQARNQNQSSGEITFSVRR